MANDLSPELFEDLVLTKKLFELLSYYPFTVVFFTQRQVNILRALLKRNKKLTVHFDTTGTVISQLHEPFEETSLYYCAMVVSCEQVDASCVPVMEFMTN